MCGLDSGVSVVGGDVEAQARNLADLKQELERLLAVTREQVERLRASDAVADSADESFRASYSEWTMANAKSVGLLAEMGSHLGHAATTFLETDGAVSIP